MIGDGGEGDDEKVGNCRPPKYTRFKPGQSGNPRGRPPKKRPDLSVPVDCPKSAALLKVGNQKVPGKIAGKNQEMTYYEAIVQKQAAIAIGGNHNAQRDFLNAHRKAEQDHAEYIARKQAEQRREFDQIVEWRQNLTKIWARAEKSGCEPDDPWPHPDDVLLDHGKLTCRVRGPMFERDVPFYEMLEAERDLHIMNEVLAWCGPQIAERRGSRAQFYRMLWLMYEQCLPKRWQLPAEQAELQIDRLLLMPIRSIRRLHRKCEARALALQKHELPLSKDVYAKVNAILKPTLRSLGYRSLAHFNSVAQSAR